MVGHCKVFAGRKDGHRIWPTLYKWTLSEIGAWKYSDLELGIGTQVNIKLLLILSTKLQIDATGLFGYLKWGNSSWNGYLGTGYMH